MTDTGAEPRVLTFDRFAERTIDLLEIEIETDVAVTPYTGLFDELALDSFQAFQLILIVESLAEIDVPPAELPVMLTLEDAYGYYCGLRSGGL